jgi:photosystem II stability/assembly factor-like uncharacterized protein
MVRRLLVSACALILAAAAAPATSAQQAQSGATSVSAHQAPPVDPALYSAMRWRLIGPHRAGRVSAVAGVPGDWTTYYMGTPGGGVWKTTDGGEVWNPIFDDQHVASIGAVAVAASNPSIVYVGTGEQTPGNGMYKSTDAGITWTHVGLEDTRYITSIVIDPKNPDVVVVGAFGHPILGTASKGDSRGVYKTTDGGKTWTKTLYKDDFAGVADMLADPGNPRVLYAALWHPRDFTEGFGTAAKQDGWIYKSIDEGSTWKQVNGAGLPSEPLDRIGLAVAPGNRGRRVFAISGQGLFRSDDAGENWTKITKDPRITGNGYICHVYVDPRNADIVYVMQTTTYRSTDGGATFSAFKGAPGGDDYHVLWIDPQDSRRMILGVDQGATISLDAGKTWSSWFNQPTGQFYHVIADNQFPYVAYAPQQDSGTAAVPSRSDFGEITYRDWFSIGGFEFCYIAPDPTNPNIVYSGGWYGSVVRFDKTTGQIAHVFVPSPKYRTSQMAPLIFSPQDPHTLYFGTQFVMKTTNQGDSWQSISPDLAARPAEPAKSEKKEEPKVSAEPSGVAAEGTTVAQLTDDHDKDRSDAGLAAGRAGHRESDNDKDAWAENDEQGRRGRAALTVIAPSPISAAVLWAGTTNGIIQRTEDSGLNWQNVSPSELTAKSTINSVEASHFDANTAFATAFLSRGDLTPLIFRTRDAGKSWQKITDGLEPGWGVWVVREDPVRKGLLYAGTDNAAYVSFDDGDQWQSLQLNLPAATIRDLVVHDNDLVIATYGRALWVLDDLSPLRQASTQIASSGAYLMRPATAIRTRWDNDQETPLPPEFPAAPNPPDGAMFYYYLKSGTQKTITLEIHDAQGNLVKRFTGDPPPADNVLKNVPDYWFGPLPQLTRNAGLNRFVWDLHYDPPPALQYSYYGSTLDYLEYTLSDHAIPGDTPREQTLGPLAVPGQYEVVLTVGDENLRQPLYVTLDPRVHVSQADLVAQLDAALRIGSGLKSSYDAFYTIGAVRTALEDRQKAVASNASAKDAQDALKDLDTKINTMQRGTFIAPGVGTVNRDLARISFMIETGDAAPSDSALAAITDSCSTLNTVIASWHELESHTLPSVNAILEKYKVAPLPTGAVAAGGSASAGGGHMHGPNPGPGDDAPGNVANPHPMDACRP